MARYIGPKTKIARKFREPIFGPDRAFDKRSYPPGQHGPSRRRGKQSEYSVQLKEKQKVKYTYGILERQFANLFDKASRREGITGEILLQLIESRLDNVVFRLGVAPSRSGARQLVSHRHITVNGSVVNIPSYSCRPGDVIAVREKSKSLEAISESLRSPNASHSWLEWDDETMSGKFVNPPMRDEILEPIKEQLIVELYSK
ncbi:MAG: 30S ribosomal protein S4 [Bacteroidia bacterium]|nr:30S ribosomal protein S4 [Bacteroidia bacterium]